MSREDILLKEYEMCQVHNDSMGSQVWVSTTIFLSINVTLLGGLLYGILTIGAFSIENLGEIVQPYILAVRIGVTVLGMGIIVILCRWKGWLKRMRFRTGVNFARMKEIESMLGMRRHTLGRLFDEAHEKRKNWTDKDKEYFANRLHFFGFKYYPASGFDGLICMAWTLIAIWVLFDAYVFVVYVGFPIINKLCGS